MILMDEMTKKFANAILSRRKQLGLTQEDIALRVGTSKQMVSKYELAQRSPKVLMANRFAEALGTTLDQLMEETAKEEPSFSEPLPVARTDEGRMAASLIDRLPKNQRKQIIGVIYAMYPHLKEGDS